ncbi:hypothetical protein KIN20_027107 [Parelaphostrongylus tenuis]|uniref:Uncharacterized protein n=1 Tax=Parelaphostrongylus tenuis TaxID=148309 RepID=A0AAD5QYX5_PARTN|nr:hypothetical protein KIN20_027107 [Parelaphostrongylus tenuis]
MEGERKLVWGVKQEGSGGRSTVNWLKSAGGSCMSRKYDSQTDQWTISMQMETYGTREVQLLLIHDLYEK